MKNDFLRIGTKLLCINKLIHVAPTKDSKFYLATFDDGIDPLWMTPNEFEELSVKLTKIKPAKAPSHL